MEKKEIEKSKKGIALCAEWLSYCLSIGWKKSHLDELEAIFWMYRDKHGELLPFDKKHSLSPSTDSSEVSESEVKRYATEWADTAHTKGSERISTIDEDTEWRNREYNFYKGIKLGLSLRSKLKSKWVVVEKEVPQYYKSVLAKSKENRYAVVHRVSDGDNQYYIITGSDEIFKNVIEWQPLPESPIK